MSAVRKDFDDWIYQDDECDDQEYEDDSDY